MTQGMGGGLFTFDISTQTMLNAPPTLTLDVRASMIEVCLDDYLYEL